MKRRYYSQRNCTNDKGRISLDVLKKLFENVYLDFYKRKYFCEKLDLGCCVDEEDKDITFLVLRKTRKELWPMSDNLGLASKLDKYIKEDIFDMMEFLFDNCSKPIKIESDHYHTWSECGYHHSHYSIKEGQKEFCDEINDFLCDFESGYELSEKGEVLHKESGGLKRLLDAKKINPKKGDIKNKMIEAEELFYRGKSNLLYHFQQTT